MIGIAIANLELGLQDIALTSFRDSLECIRTSGSLVELACYKYAICYFLAKTNQTEKALQLFSFIKNQYKKIGFRPWITHRSCLDYAEEIYTMIVTL